MPRRMIFASVRKPARPTAAKASPTQSASKVKPIIPILTKPRLDHLSVLGGRDPRRLAGRFATNEGTLAGFAAQQAAMLRSVERIERALDAQRARRWRRQIPAAPLCGSLNLVSNFSHAWCYSAEAGR